MPSVASEVTMGDVDSKTWESWRQAETDREVTQKGERHEHMYGRS